MTILIVEDDPIIVDLLQHVLKPVADTILSTPYGMEGLRIAQNNEIDAAIVDIFLKDRDFDGLGLVRAVRQDPIIQHLPLIVLSAGMSLNLEEEAMAAGADLFLRKPFKAIELRQILRDFLDRTPQSDG